MDDAEDKGQILFETHEEREKKRKRRAEEKKRIEGRWSTKRQQQEHGHILHFSHLNTASRTTPSLSSRCDEEVILNENGMGDAEEEESENESGCASENENDHHGEDRAHSAHRGWVAGEEHSDHAHGKDRARMKDTLVAMEERDRRGLQNGNFDDGDPGPDTDQG